MDTLRHEMGQDPYVPTQKMIYPIPIFKFQNSNTPGQVRMNSHVNLNWLDPIILLARKTVMKPAEVLQPPATSATPLLPKSSES